MKKFKILVVLIILGILGLFIYQNITYFMTKETVGVHLQFFQWDSPPVPVLLYWGICFALGLLIAGIRGFAKSFVLGREIKKKNAAIQALEIQISDLQTRVDDLTRTPCQQTITDSSQLPEPEDSQRQKKDSSINAQVSAQESGAPRKVNQDQTSSSDGDS